MDFIVSSILSGIIYDLVKGGTLLSYSNIFGKFNTSNFDYSIGKKFIDEINQVTEQDKKIEYANKLLTNENRYTVMFESQLYTTNFAKRIDYVIYLMNEIHSINKNAFNLEIMGEYLGFSSVNDLKKYFLYAEEPRYSFIEEVADKLGLSSTWLKYGHGEPFESKLPSIDRAYGILDHESFDQTKELIFVISDSPYRRDIGIIRKTDKFKYDYYPSTIVFHGDVGGGGTSALYSLYQFLRELRRRGLLPQGVYKLPEDYFNSLFKGAIYPGSVEGLRRCYVSYLLEDFINLFTSEEKMEQYEKSYGKPFVDCQKIIKHGINSGLASSC